MEQDPQVKVPVQAEDLDAAGAVVEAEWADSGWEPADDASARAAARRRRIR